jgi:hypothetical protein
MDGGPEGVWISAGRTKARKLNRADKEPVVYAMKSCRPTGGLCIARLSCVATGRPATDLVPPVTRRVRCWHFRDVRRCPLFRCFRGMSGVRRETGKE